MPESGIMVLHFIPKCKRHLSANSGAVRLSHCHSRTNNMTSINYIAQEGASQTAKGKLTCNIGLNDSSKPVTISGKIIKSYDTWRNMLARCYSTKYQKKHPTYAGCSVSEEWQLFSNFEKWFSSNYVEGWQLDKDILSPGNKVYSADTCVFVPQKLNNLLLDCRAARGAYLLGVDFHKPRQKYRASVNTGTGRLYIGYFITQLEAHRVYQLAKADSIATAETDNLRIRAALALRAAKLRDDHANNRITVKV